MQSFVDFIQGFLALGATVILPVAIFLLGLFFGQKPGKAFRSGLTIGVAFVGIFLVIDLLTTNLGPAAQGMVDRLGVELNVIDVGWPATSSIAWASVVAAFIIPLGLVVNVVMLLTKTTRVMNVDIWNYWHYTFMAAVIYAISGSIIQGLIAAVLFQIVCLKIADWTTPMVRDFYEMPGVSVATGSTISYAPFIFLVKGIQRIPGLKNLKADADSIQKRFGVFGDSMVIGLILGAAIGALAGYDFGKIINIGMSMAAVMILMPRMVKILMEGLMPVSESARNWLNKKFGDSDITIGLDAAVLLGHPSVIATALILTPITVLIAVILPGNNVLPFGDLATIPFVIAFIVGAARGNIIHSVIVGTIMIALSLYMATDIAPVFSQMATEASIKLPEGSAMVSSIDQGGNLINWVIWRVFDLFN
ncbi:galactitol-specific PTS transporter subunit IIC [Ornithinibacillus bavariensis]|uniref:PTS galactitol transporter subunit IIC n=1 Tax=Ornithinibacillus bavariensis TaxID=545502 RepID=A0A919X8X6_9BACI|nr:PTS galactitol transporter subunit IIC [Ornithinibacillus bavariensis]GIO27008.1 PTS galactitol transporter subunit IIC [Ornithinibacillus bavariensis]HAM80083.1 PTS galactitol transporter subunit IIC [Ornithinibacillus sp.]